MSECEAVTLAQNKLRDGPQEGAIYLVKALDCIPLAIIQAAAYINRLGSRMSAAKYLSELHGVEGQVQLLQKAASDMRRDEEAQKSVLATWQISFEYHTTSDRQQQICCRSRASSTGRDTLNS